MTTFNCPRCGRPSTPERCPSCGRGPEPLLTRLTELDAALRVLSSGTNSRSAVESERVQVLDELGRLAASYRTAAPVTSPPTADTPAVIHTPATAGTPAAMPAAPQGPPPPQTPAGPPLPGGFPATPPPVAVRPRREVGSKTVQTLLLGLGGLLVAAAIIIFTAVAWRHMGDTGRLLVLGAFTALMLSLPAVLIRFRLWATAETFAALAALALWCSALAGYYQILPSGASLTAEAVGTWTMLVLAVLAAYRAGITATASGWALLPLAAVGSAYAAAGETTNAALLMAGIAVVLAAGSWIVGHRPSRHPRSDLWASRLLLCGAVVLAFLAGLRIAFDLDKELVAPIAAVMTVLAAGNLVATVYARRAGAAITTVMVASSATVAMTVAAWVLAARSDETALIIPSLALLAAIAAAAIDELAGTDGEASRKASGLAAIAALAAFAIVVTDAPDLTSYLIAAVLVGLLSLALPEPLRRSLRHAAYIGGGAIAAAATAIALAALPSLWWDSGFPELLTWEVPIVLALLALSAALVPEQRRFDVVAIALTLAAIAASMLLWHGDPSRFDAMPVVGFALAALIALVGAMASSTLGGRCASWCLLVVWLPLTASAAGASSSIDASASQLGFGLVAAAAAMLATAAGAPRRSRIDRVLAAILAHVLAGVTAGTMMVAEWFGQLISDANASLYLPAALGIYTLALTGVALMAPVKKQPYVIAALATGTAAWWTLLTALGEETLEVFTGPPALVLFILGLWQLLRRPEAGSWAQLAAPIAVGIGPSLLLALGEEGDPVRRVGVGAAALAVVVAGLARRWQAPLVLGSIALVVLTINELALVWHAIPQWIAPAVGGAILIAAGATFEKRRRDLVRLRNGLRAMR
ncbi:SCO7613 C-terminal domain-containing membrane protein [Glycomyces arizonensis]|uniref:SCO7613 C-terminal domain-containing membrane protein n=1 Tax=Glycomyces arizonensis TaxID=256035 RepID=UPI0004789F6D|nr:hypothetical protein [Glycomyces arizonensis]